MELLVILFLYKLYAHINIFKNHIEIDINIFLQKYFLFKVEVSSQWI